MKAYIITEEQKEALLKALELEKMHTPDQFATTPELRAMQTKAVESIHRRMHYEVCKLLS